MNSPDLTEEIELGWDGPDAARSEILSSLQRYQDSVKQ